MITQQENWCQLGDLAYNKIQLYHMTWGEILDLNKCCVIGSKFGGSIAVFPLEDSVHSRNNSIQQQHYTKQASFTTRQPAPIFNNQSHFYPSLEDFKTNSVIPFKPKFMIYSCKGNRISVGQSRGVNIVFVGWSHNQLLILLQSDGTILVYDLLGILQREYRIDMSIVGKNYMIVDAQLVTPSHTSTSIIFVCKKVPQSTNSSQTLKDMQPKFYCCSNIPLSDDQCKEQSSKQATGQPIQQTDIPTINCIKLSDTNVPASSPLCWSVLIKNTKLKVTSSSANGPRLDVSVVVAHSQNLYILDESSVNSSASLVVSSTQPKTTSQQQQLQQATAALSGLLSCAVVNISVSTEPITRLALLTSNGRLSVISIGLDDQYNKNYVETKLREFDTRASAVSYVSWCGQNAICALRCDSLLLLDLDDNSDSLSVDSGTIKCIVDEIDCIRLIGSTKHEMLIQVAPVCRELFRVATLSPGALLVQAYKDHLKRDLRSYEAIQSIKERRELNSAVLKCISGAGYEYELERQRLLLNSAHFGKTFVPSIAVFEYSSMCKKLRALYTLRHAGIPLTYIQFEQLAPTLLLDLLISMEKFSLAYWIAMWFKQYDDAHNVLLSWAASRIKKNHLSDEQVAEDIRQIFEHNSSVSFADIASRAIEQNRMYLALKLIEFETQSTKQIPLLLSLRQFDLVFPRALESCDSNLIYMSIFSLLETTKDETRFVSQLKKHNLAFSYYCRYLFETNVQKLKLILHSTRSYEQELRVYHIQSNLKQNKLKTSSKHSYIDQLDSLINVSKLIDKNEFATKQLELRVKLVKFQYGLETSVKQPPPRASGWVDLSASQTIINLLELKETTKARECEKLAQISDKKFEILYQIATKGSPGPIQLE